MVLKDVKFRVVTGTVEANRKVINAFMDTPGGSWVNNTNSRENLPGEPVLDSFFLYTKRGKLVACRGSSRRSTLETLQRYTELGNLPNMTPDQVVELLSQVDKPQGCWIEFPVDNQTGHVHIGEGVPMSLHFNDITHIMSCEDKFLKMAGGKLRAFGGYLWANGAWCQELKGINTLNSEIIATDCWVRPAIPRKVRFWLE